MIIIDEGGQTKELEAIIPMIHNVNSAEVIIIVGDSKQLDPTVKSGSKNRGGEIENPFAPQMNISLQKRLENCGHPTSTFGHEFRMTDGLERWSSIEFYRRQLVPHESALLKNREISRKANDLVKKEYNVATTTPHLFLHLPGGAPERISIAERD